MTGNLNLKTQLILTKRMTYEIYAYFCVASHYIYVCCGIVVAKNYIYAGKARVECVLKLQNCSSVLCTLPDKS